MSVEHGDLGPCFRPQGWPLRDLYLYRMADSHTGGEAPSQTWAGLTLGLVGRALINPRLAVDLLRMAWSFRRRFWWRTAPFLPVPDPVYLRWRMYTAYGSEDAVPPIDDIVRFARWRRETMRL